MIDDIQKLIEATSNSTNAAKLIAVYLEEQIDLAANGWFDGDSIWRDIDEVEYVALKEKIENIFSRKIDATEELLSIPGFKEDFERAKQQIKEGKTVCWKDVREDV